MLGVAYGQGDSRMIKNLIFLSTLLCSTAIADPIEIIVQNDSGVSTSGSVEFDRLNISCAFGHDKQACVTIDAYLRDIQKDDPFSVWLRQHEKKQNQDAEKSKQDSSQR